MENILLEKLLSSELLTEETRKELAEGFTKMLNEAVEEEKAKILVELSQQFVTERAQLIEALDTKVNERLEAELAPFKQDILDYRDKDVEYAQRLVEATNKVKADAKEDLKTLVEQVNDYLDIVLNEQFTELKNDIEECKKIRYGSEIFEAVQKTFERKFVNKESIANQLKEANEKLENANKKLLETQESLKQAERSQKLTAVLENLNGRSKELMEVLLANVPTNKLEETYAKHINKVLAETIGTVDTKSEKETKVLAESKTNEVVLESQAPDVKVITGNNKEKIDESKTVTTLSEGERLKVRRLAGISD
jgi:uncharacterized protein YejL (UPF0352 family)